MLKKAEQKPTIQTAQGRGMIWSFSQKKNKLKTP